jgi:hypothetical protein
MVLPVDLSLRPDLRRPELFSQDFQARLNPGGSVGIRQAGVNPNGTGHAGETLGRRQEPWERMAAFQGGGGGGFHRASIDYGSNRARDQRMKQGGGTAGTVVIDGPAPRPEQRPFELPAGLSGFARSALVAERAANFEEQSRGNLARLGRAR